MTRSPTRLVEFPMDVTPPTAHDVEASAKSSPLVAALSRLRDFLGPTGLKLSAAGGLTFDSERVITDMLGLTVIEPPSPDAQPMCADPVPRFTLALAIAIECGAVRQARNRLVPVDSWDDEDVIVQAAVALSTLIELGPLWTSMPRGDWFFDLRDAVLDGSFVNWLATLLPEGREQRVDHFVNWGVDACREQIGTNPFEQEDALDIWVDNGTCYLIDALTWAAAIEWFDQELRWRELHDGGGQWFAGGSIRLTALGRHVLPDHLAAAGIKLREPDGAGMRSASALVGDILVTEGDDARRGLVDAWRPDLEVRERARLVAEFLLDASGAPWRMSGFEVLEIIGPDAAEPYERQLLDSPASEDAAQFLVRHGLADEEQMKAFQGYGPLIELFATLVGQPDRLREWFVRLLERCEAPELLLEVIALYPTAEATMLLTAAARHVTDPRYADLIRAAERYHHEWMAERDPAL